MASKKNRSSWAKEKAQFNAQLGGFDALDDVFAREDSRHAHLAEERDSAQRYKACESKNRYATLAEAQENLAWCQKQGKRGLQIYECPLLRRLASNLASLGERAIAVSLFRTVSATSPKCPAQSVRGVGWLLSGGGEAGLVAAESFRVAVGFAERRLERASGQAVVVVVLRHVHGHHRLRQAQARGARFGN